MKLSDVFFIVFYGAIFLLVIYVIIKLVRPTQPNSIVVYGDETPVYQEDVWWPWAYGPYNYWPYWFPWAAGGAGAYGYYRGGGHRHWTGGRPWGGAGRGAHGGSGSHGGAHGGGGHH